MITAVPFLFGAPSYDTNRVFYARLTSELYKQSQLFEALYYLLWFPGYFGFNWNALSDCLKDFSWIKERDIVLVHDGLPKLDDSDLKIYLEVLRDAVNDWGPADEHRLGIVFAESDRERVLHFLNS
jgi:hypothetical protein